MSAGGRLAGFVCFGIFRLCSAGRTSSTLWHRAPEQSALSSTSTHLRMWWWTAKFFASIADRSRYCPPRWTWLYEEDLSRRPFCRSLDHQRNTFCLGLYFPHLARSIHRPAQERLASANFLSEYSATCGREIRSEAFARFRSRKNEYLYFEPREHLRSFRVVLGRSSISARFRTRISLQDSDLRLDDGALWQCSGAGQSDPRRARGDDPARPSGARFRHQSSCFSGSFAHPRWPHSRIQERDF